MSSVPPEPPGADRSPSRHGTLVELADLAEGLLPPARAAELAAHLAGCARCADRRAALVAVSATLAADRPALPPAVAARWDAAVAAASRDRAGAPAPATVQPVGTPARTAARVGARAGARRPGPGWWRGLAAVAASVAVLAAGAGGYRWLSSGPARSTAVTAGGARAVAALPVEASGQDYTAGTLPAAAAALAANPPSPGLVAPPDQAARTAPMRGAGPEGGGPPGGPVPAELAPLTEPARLRACVAALTGAPSGAPLRLAPLAVDLARFDGLPAAVVVLPSAVAGQLDVYVVGPACGAPADDARYFTRVPR